METKLLIEAFSSQFLSLVNIHNLPSLMSTFFTVSAANLNGLTFLILGLVYLENLVVGWVDEVLSLKLEYLEPSRVSAPDLHVGSSASTLDIPRLIVQSSSDGL
jgi:hypothetical protein